MFTSYYSRFRKVFINFVILIINQMYLTRKTKKFGDSIFQKKKMSHPIKLVPERYESSAEQPSQNQNLVPRKCWLRITQLLMKPSLFEKNQKLRIIVHVPNSNREVKTKKISLDEHAIRFLQTHTNNAGFSQIPIDATIIYEYKHDIQVEHPSIMIIDVEVISSILGRTKRIGQLSVNMSEVIQKNIKNTFSIGKEGNVIALLTAEIFSMSIARKTPEGIVHSYSTLSDSESELDPESVGASESLLPKMISQKRIVFADDNSSEGQIIKQYLSVTDYYIPVRSVSTIQKFLNAASQIVPSQNPIVVVLAGDDFFVCSFLKEIAAFRDRGLINQESFAIFVLPLKPKNSTFAQFLGGKSLKYTNQFLNQKWYDFFSEENSTPIHGPQVCGTISQLFTSEMKPFIVSVGDVLITTMSDQYVVPMFNDIAIGDPTTMDRSKQANPPFNAKCTFTSNKSRHDAIKFHLMHITMDQNGNITVGWSILTSNLMQIFQSNDKQQIETETEKCTKFSMTNTKGQQPLDILIDGHKISGVIGLSVTLRDHSASVSLSCFTE